MAREIGELALVLRNEELARILAAAPGGWRDLSDGELVELGVRAAQRRRVATLQKLVRLSYPALEHVELSQPERVGAVYGERLGGLMHEIMLAIGLDGRNRVIGEVEVAQLLASMQPGEGQSKFTHLLTTRRMHSVMNSTGNMLAATLRRSPHNPAYMNPEELAALDLEEGDAIEIASEYGRVEASVASDASLRRGILSIAHCWGAVADEGVPGANVNLLIPCDRHVEPINAMPRMSAVPVRIAKLSAGA